jgi:ubiquinone/menaquinone biosynthesis C-methylase UbiE
MNFKHLFPTFRNRYKFVKRELARLGQKHTFDRALNLGTGEGDYDRMIAGYVREMIGCDVNEADLVHARRVNEGVMNLRYEVNNALELTYPSGNFDLIVSSEVLEHVGDPAKMIQEMYRVMAPGGYAIMTFPSREFPFTYDPVNRIWQWIRGKERKEYLISQGAYAFGHDYLIGSMDFMNYTRAAGFEVVSFRPLSGYLTGLLEMYWTGIVQRIFKKNAGNVTTDSTSAIKVRPSNVSEPGLAVVTDGFIWLDDFWFGSFTNSVGKGVVLHKPLA